MVKAGSDAICVAEGPRIVPRRSTTTDDTRTVASLSRRPDQSEPDASLPTQHGELPCAVHRVDCAADWRWNGQDVCRSGSRIDRRVEQPEACRRAEILPGQAKGARPERSGIPGGHRTT